MEGQDTLGNILRSAKHEFLQKGFRCASLRTIVRNANVTTCAFYGYFKSKEELFDVLVSKQANDFIDAFNDVQMNFRKLSPQEQLRNIGKATGQWMLNILDYIYDNFDSFKLILKYSEGTKYENFIHNLAEIEVDAMHDILTSAEKSGRSVRKIDSNLEHILNSGKFSAYFEIVMHDMPKEQAKIYIGDLTEFLAAGWVRIMGL